MASPMTLVVTQFTQPLSTTFFQLSTLLHEYQPTPWILLVTKGPLKIRLLEELILAIDIFFPI